MDQKKIAQFVEENIKTIYAYALTRVSHYVYPYAQGELSYVLA